jgi:dihydrofolate synthase / folylpolyglutamate synthase
MQIRAVRTKKILPGAVTVTALLDEVLPSVAEQSVVVVTSKIVALCENAVVPVDGTDREALLRRESDLYYIPNQNGEHEYNFTIKQNTLIPAAGIDVSNGNGDYILWPKNSLASADLIRSHLRTRDGVDQLGVIITDSTVSLSRWGTLGIAIGHSGFDPVKNYIGQPDLFDRPMMFSSANMAGGLAAAAVVAMGEGAEQTPIAVIEDVPMVDFWRGEAREPNTPGYYISPLNDDPYRPFFGAVTWHKGGTTGEDSSEQQTV